MKTFLLVAFAGLGLAAFADPVNPRVPNGRDQLQPAQALGYDGGAYEVDQNESLQQGSGDLEHLRGDEECLSGWLDGYGDI